MVPVTVSGFGLTPLWGQSALLLGPTLPDQRSDTATVYFRSPASSRRSISCE